ncbi:Unknown protein [Striga hermonthica]|uniref:Uncharacterized protein n=1 Tax=Striga hermonthica TaxID=68872 RepID=A0A9N7RKE8_STRHE|nr:Unknown protein [Striga hermonthica]
MPGEYNFPKGSVCLNAVAKVWAQVRQGARWALGDGRQARFWTDLWLNVKEPLITMVRARPPIELLHGPVADYVTTTGEWWWEKFEDFLPATALLLVAAVMPPSSSSRADRLIWGYTSNGIFSTRTAYEALTRRAENNVRPLWKAVWRAPTTQRHALSAVCTRQHYMYIETARRLGVSGWSYFHLRVGGTSSRRMCRSGCGRI